MPVLRWLKPPLKAARTAWRAARQALGVSPPAAPPPRHAAPPPPPVAPAAAQAAPIEVVIEETPNPHARKLQASRPLRPRGTLAASTPEEAGGDRVALALLSVEGVRSVFLTPDFVTVTRAPDARWSALEPALRDAVQRGLSGAP